MILIIILLLNKKKRKKRKIRLKILLKETKFHLILIYILKNIFIKFLKKNIK